MAKIFNHLISSIRTGNVPDDWQNGNIAPISKKGDKHKPSNYRPVSLTSIYSKLIEHVLVFNIRKYLDPNAYSLMNSMVLGLKCSCDKQDAK